MRLRHQGLLLAATVAAIALAQPAKADLLVSIDKSTQQMTVSVDGVARYVWPVSTGGQGYDTPDGEFKPFRMDKDHFSREWDDAPMPYSIFFTKIGHAIHGTYETKNLGKPVSHGCVRLSRANAAILWGLVKEQKMANTKVVLTGEIPGGPGVPVARRLPNYQRDQRSDGYYRDDRGDGYYRSYRSDSDRYYYGDESAEVAARARPAPGWGGYGNRPTYYYRGRQPYYYQGAQPYDDQGGQPYAARPYYGAPAPAPSPFGW